MLDFVMYVFGFYVLVLFVFVVWESSIMIQDKKDRQRRGTTDYYDNTIKNNVASY